MQESILLRTLGATRSQILRILTAEYALLGILAALNGIVLANLAAWAISRWVFEIPFELRFFAGVGGGGSGDNADAVGRRVRKPPCLESPAAGGAAGRKLRTAGIAFIADEMQRCVSAGGGTKPRLEASEILELSRTWAY